MQISDELAQLPAFAGLDSAARDALAETVTARTLACDEVLFAEGDPPGDLFVIRRGHVQLTRRFDGRGDVVVATLADGELLGWTGLLRRTRVAGARALEETTLWCFRASSLLEVCERDPRVGYRIMSLAFEEVADRLHATRLQLLDVYGSR
ncbi:MAG: cyclic nucleotide-binding domain-containing protein [Polyangiales bacterium]